ncbi:MAG: response regulator, partial [Thermoplasmata archaeon]|nr:response regulator [Thermoplasmata archaeon]
LELAMDTGVDEERKEYMGMAKDSAKTLMTIINDILDFSKIEANRLDMESVDFDLISLVEKTCTPLSLDAHKKGLEFMYDIDPGVRSNVVGDPTRLRQTITNLIRNAVKFTEEGHVLLRVEEESTEGDVVKLHFSVEDTGIGIMEGKLSKIFEEFTQADGSTTRRFGGTGLGLTISRRLVKIMGGDIWVESQEDMGSTFHFTVVMERGAGCESIRSIGSPCIWGLRALVVDDNGVNRLILTRMLRSWGMEPTAVEGGIECLKELERVKDAGERYDFLLVDSQMPGMDGFELVRRLKEEGSTEDMVTMMLTSNDQKGDRARCRELGISSYLIKPICPSALMDSIMGLWDRQGGVDDAKKETMSEEAIREQEDEEKGLPALNILLAEDNAVNRALAIILLEKAGLNVSPAKNGLEALTAFEGGSFDLILMDIQMPIIDGLEATKKIRESEWKRGGHTPIIALTAHAMQGDRERFLEAGMDDYLSKPLDFDQLYETISKYANGREGEDGEGEDSVGEEGGGEGEDSVGEESDSFLDVDNLRSRVGGNEELVHELLGMYVDESKGLLAKTEIAVHNNDPGELKASAHALKGMSASISAKSVRETAYELEKIGMSSNLSKAVIKLSTLKKSLQRTLITISEYMVDYNAMGGMST